MAAQDAALGHPDAAVFRAQAEALRGLRHPFRGEAEILHEECLWDVDRDVVLRVCRHMRGDILLVCRRGRWIRLDAGAGKLAVRAQRPAGAALGRRVAWDALRVNHEARLTPPVFAVVALCKQAAGRFAA